MPKMLCLLGAGLLLAGCQTTNQRAASQIGVASMAAPDGQILGSARLFVLGEEVTLNLAMHKLPGPAHMVRLDERGDCTGAAIVGAAVQLSPSENPPNPGSSPGPYIAALPDIPAGVDGSGTMSALLPRGQGDILSAIFDEDGTALIVEQASGGAQLPAQGAGARPIACGVLQPVR